MQAAADVAARRELPSARHWKRFLTVVGIVLFVLVGVGLLTKPFWKRIATYFRRWWERDMRAEQQQREEAECRRKARQEVSELCHDAIERRGKKRHRTRRE